MTEQTADELAILRKLADAIPEKPKGDFAFFKLVEEAHYFRARAAFFDYACLCLDTHDQTRPQGKYGQIVAIIAAVRAKEQP